MAKVVQADVLDSGSGEGDAPSVAEGVWVWRRILDASEQPVAEESQSGVFGEHLQQGVGD